MLSREELTIRNNKIFSLHKAGKTQREIAGMFGLTRQSVNLILHKFGVRGYREKPSAAFLDKLKIRIENHVPKLKEKEYTEVNVTQSYLKDIFDYDKISGNLIAKTKRNGSCPVGHIPGTVTDNNGDKYYRHIMVNKTIWGAHRLVWCWHYGCFPKNDIDHINGDGLDNRIENLRDCHHSVNMKNAKAKNLRYRLYGLNKYRGRYNASIVADGITYKLGTYSEWFDAACARKSAEYKLGFHKNHGRLV